MRLARIEVDLERCRYVRVVDIDDPISCVSRWLVPGTLSVLFVGCGLVADVCPFGCSFLNCSLRLLHKGNFGHIYLWVRHPIFPKAMTDEGINTLDENILKNGFVIDACDFARL